MLTETMYDYRIEQQKANIVGKCVECGNQIYQGWEDCYRFENDLVCEDCLTDYCNKNFKEV